MTLEEQQEFRERYAHEAYERLFGFLALNRDEIIRRMEPRLAGGYPEYGDRSWHEPHDKKVSEIVDECTDALNRMVMLLSETERGE